MAKAVRATASAKILLDTGDVDGACDRAYYAMFNAARAALLASSAPVQADISRTHSGLIAAFSLHLVKPGQVSVDLGRALNKLEELRLIAHYKGDPIDLEQAAWAVEMSRIFVLSMQVQFIPVKDEEGNPSQ